MADKTPTPDVPRTQEQKDAAAAVAAATLVMEPEGCGYNYILDDAVVQPFDFYLPVIRELREQHELRPYDVVISTYPKCGTTWMQQVVLLLLRGSDAESFAPMHDGKPPSPMHDCKPL